MQNAQFTATQRCRCCSNHAGNTVAVTEGETSKSVRIVLTCGRCGAKFGQSDVTNDQPILMCGGCAKPTKHARKGEVSATWETPSDVANARGTSPVKLENYVCVACGSSRAFGVAKDGAEACKRRMIPTTY